MPLNSYSYNMASESFAEFDDVTLGKPAAPSHSLLLDDPAALLSQPSAYLNENTSANRNSNGSNILPPPLSNTSSSSSSLSNSSSPSPSPSPTSSPLFSTPLYLPGNNGTATAIPLEYTDSSSSSSSRSSSARSSTNSTNSTAITAVSDDDYLSDPKQLAPTGSNTPISTATITAPKSRRGSTNTVMSIASSLASSDEDADITGDDPFSSISIASNDQAIAAPASNKLNGHLIHSLKSKSSVSLLNPNQAASQARQGSTTQLQLQPQLPQQSAPLPQQKPQHHQPQQQQQQLVGKLAPGFLPSLDTAHGSRYSSNPMYNTSNSSSSTTVTGSPRAAAPASPTTATTSPRHALKGASPFGSSSSPDLSRGSRQARSPSHPNNASLTGSPYSSASGSVSGPYSPGYPHAPPGNNNNSNNGNRSFIKPSQSAILLAQASQASQGFRVTRRSSATATYYSSSSSSPQDLLPSNNTTSPRHSKTAATPTTPSPAGPRSNVSPNSNLSNTSKNTSAPSLRHTSSLSRISSASPEPRGTVPESINETDAFAPLPTSKKNLQRALSSRLSRSHSNLSAYPPAAGRQSDVLSSSPSTSSLVGPGAYARGPPKRSNSTTAISQPSAGGSPPQQQLTSQQRFRMRRSRSTTRLTTEQLEMQFDSDDFDTDIPNDSLAWNVPLSPALYAKTQLQSSTAQKSKMASAKSSSKHSRRRNSSGGAGSKSGGLAQGLSSPLSTLSSASSSTPNLLAAPSLTHSPTVSPPETSLNTIKESEPTVFFSSAGLENLCEDARILTMAFQDLPTSKTFDADMKRRVERASAMKLPPKNRSYPSLQIPTSPQRPASVPAFSTVAPGSPESPLSSFRNSVASLPQPTMMESDLNLPISKEKEAVLSRTRPSWLPPKSADEERKHVLEFQAMMARIDEQEKHVEAKKKQETLEQEKQIKRDEKAWKALMQPGTFDKTLVLMKDTSPKTRELWWRGVPSKYRAQVWKARIGNALGVSKTTYERALARAHALMENDTRGAAARSGEASLTREQGAQILAQFTQIEGDIEHTFPEIKLFDAECGPFHDALVDILHAFAVYRPSVGYQRGLSHLAASLLLNMEPLDAFIALANVLGGSLESEAKDAAAAAASTPTTPVPVTPFQHQLLGALYARNERELTGYYQSFLKVLHSKMPSLYTHFKTIHLAPSAYLAPLLMPLFGAHAPSIDVVSRIWDVMLFEGDSFLLRVALAILAKTEHKLYQDSAEAVLATIGWPAYKDADDQAADRRDSRASTQLANGCLNLGSEDAFMGLVRGVFKN